MADDKDMAAVSDAAPNALRDDDGAVRAEFVGTVAEAIADLFNVMNANTGLVRNRNAGSTTFNQLVQNLSPRILRFGVRVTF